MTLSEIEKQAVWDFIDQTEDLYKEFVESKNLEDEFFAYAREQQLDEEEEHR